MDNPVGIFDSGIGGLTVVKEVIKLLPHENLVYFGDTARVPYGIKSKETIIKFSLENTLFLLQQDVKMIVIACNTSSSLALPIIRRHFKIPIIGVIMPGAKEAVYATKNKKVGVIGTRATINSGAYEEEIKRLDAGIKVFSQACPMFVPIVEEGWINDAITTKVAEKYLSVLKSKGIDTLILGCTHYPLLKNKIQQVMGKAVKLIDSAEQVAIEVKQVLSQEGVLNKERSRPSREYFVSDEVAIFKNVAKSFLGNELKEVKRVSNV
ncbi:MAG TPA: glutamate racemase [Candidatus Omnitrophica bacterium]|nr:glutamate racemase [Candidatus Omnitrophota bacterium]